jgi:hypothetical protein
MDKVTKLELIQRSLGLRHKLKVHESMKQPETHEDIAIMLLTKWEYEDELRAIEEMLAESRSQNAHSKRQQILKEGVKLKREIPHAPTLSDDEATDEEEAVALRPKPAPKRKK